MVRKVVEMSFRDLWHSSDVSGFKFSGEGGFDARIWDDRPSVREGKLVKEFKEWANYAFQDKRDLMKKGGFTQAEFEYEIVGESHGEKSVNMFTVTIGACGNWTEVSPGCWE